MMAGPPPPLSAYEFLILRALAQRIAAHPDPEVALFMTARERNLLFRCGDLIIWRADHDPAYAELAGDAIAEALGLG